MKKSGAYHHGDLKNALIKAGIQVLAQDGVSGLSLRKVARKAGVSHNAPYAHFADKQALIASIAIDGHARLRVLIERVIGQFPDDPLRQLVHLAWAYMQFGLEFPAHYKIIFSGLIENEKNHPAFVQVSRHSLLLLNQIVADCQAAGILSSSDGDVEMVAVSIWGLIHGLVSLVIEGQVPSKLMKRNPPEAMVIAALQQVIRVPMEAGILAP